MKFRIVESFKNVFDTKTMEKYVDEVWQLLVDSYSYLNEGFIVFSDKKYMIDNSYFWKLMIKNNEVKAVIIYKNRGNIRKSVAFGSKKGEFPYIVNMIISDLDRAIMEVSSKLEKNIIRHLGGYDSKYIIPNTEAEKIINKPIKPLDDGIHYTREFAGKTYTKMLIGTVTRNY